MRWTTGSLSGGTEAALRESGRDGRSCPGDLSGPSRARCYCATSRFVVLDRLVWMAGFEPATSCARGMRSPKLSYIQIGWYRARESNPPVPV